MFTRIERLKVNRQVQRQTRVVSHSTRVKSLIEWATSGLLNEWYWLIEIPVAVPLPRRPIVRKRYDEEMGGGFRCVQPRGEVK